MPNPRHPSPGTRYVNATIQDFVLIPPTQWLMIPVGIQPSLKSDGDSPTAVHQPIRKRFPDFRSGSHIMDLYHFPQQLRNRVIITYPGDDQTPDFVLTTKVQVWLTAEDKERWDEVALQNGLTPYSNLLVRFERCLEHKEQRPGGILVTRVVYYKLVDVRAELPRADGTAVSTAPEEPRTAVEVEPPLPSPTEQAVELSAPLAAG